MAPKHARTGRLGIGFVAGIAVISLLLSIIAYMRPAFNENVENQILSALVRRMELPEIDEKLVLVIGGDRSINEIGMWPWPRSTYIKLLDERLYSARTVALDILLVDEGAGGDDDALADAFARHGNVVLCYAEEIDGNPSLHSLPKFIEAAAGEGYSNGYHDSDGFMRRYRFFEEKQIIAPSFVCATAMASGYMFDWEYDNKGATLHVISPDGGMKKIRVDRDTQYLRFPAPKHQIATYELSDVLTGKIPPEEFDGAIVMIGFNASGAADAVSAADGLVSGTQYNIDSLYTVLSGVNPERASPAAEAAIAVAMFLISVFLTRKMRIHISFLSAVILSGVWVAAVFALFLSDTVWLGSFVPLSAIVLGCAFALISELLRSQRDLRVRTISMDSLGGLSQSLAENSSFESFSEYLAVLAPEIESAAGMEILDSLIDEGSEKLDRLGADEAQNGLVIAYNVSKLPPAHQVLVKLPFLSGSGRCQQFTLLGMRAKVDEATIKSVATVIVTAYVYFNAARDAKERSDMFLSLIRCMISAVDAKDPITSGHSQRVAELSEEIARLLGLSERQVEQMRFSGMIHDIGKIGIPDSILAKPGPFSDAEFKAMKHHPSKGGSIMEAISLTPEILDGVLYHHERLDGKGYPFGKTGDELSLTPRIIKIADVYDALCSERQYKKAWPVARALNILYEGRGTEFDGDIVDAFIEKVKPEGWEPSPRQQSQSAPSDFVIGKYKAAIKLLTETARGSNHEAAGVFTGEGDLEARDSFYSIEWYGSYNNEDFLGMKPQILLAESDKLIFYLNATNFVSDVIYYFLRGFLLAGAVFCDGEAKSGLESKFNAPVYCDSEITLWDARRMVVAHIEKSNDTPAAIFYIMKSILDE